MSEMTAEQFAQRAFHFNLLDERQLDSVWGEFGTRNVDAAEFRTVLVRRELMTNYQVEKLLRGDRSGYFYGDYKMLYLVGTGTFARVFRAVNSSNGRVVAVKVLRKRFSEDLEKTEQFLREGQMGATLRHPAIVPIYEVHSTGKDLFLVMEFVEGQNLRHFVKVRTKVDPMEATKLMIDVCSGLAYAFDHGVTHRDLKLSNVLVSSLGRARLVDFGLAAIGGGKMSDEDMAKFPNPRTIDYAALERATGVRKDDKRSDVYFTGCILYHMLTGVAPLRETKDRLQRMSITRFEEIKPVTALEPAMPVPLAIVVNKSMELNPSRRYQTPAEMCEDLKMAQQRLEDAAERGESLAANEVGIPADADVVHPGKVTPKSEGDGKTILVVESDGKMQDVFRKQLKKYGYRVLIIADIDRAVARFQDQHVADCVIFCANKFGEAALKTFNDFGRLERTRHVPAILLLSEKQMSWDEKAKPGGHRGVLVMPIQMRDLRKMLLEVIDCEQAAE